MDHKKAQGLINIDSLREMAPNAATMDAFQNAAEYAIRRAEMHMTEEAAEKEFLMFVQNCVDQADLLKEKLEGFKI